MRTTEKKAAGHEAGGSANGVTLQILAGRRRPNEADSQQQKAPAPVIAAC
jgi:hypothetical protein